MIDLPHSRLIDFLLLLTPRRRRFRISGLSMSPYLVDGDEVIAEINPAILEIHDVIVLSHPLRSDIIMIKRIKKIIVDDNQKRYFVTGDNLSASTDSRHFGFVDRRLIIAKVICRFP